MTSRGTLRLLMTLITGCTVSISGCTGAERASGLPSADVPVVPAAAGVATASRPGFQFAPPIAKSAPVPTGAFDELLSPTVQICELGTGGSCARTVATFTSAAGQGGERVRLDLAGQQYTVSWKADDPSLDFARTYRIRVLLWALEIGFADVRVVATTQALKGLDPSIVGVVAGRALPIKFRIEEAALWSGLPAIAPSRASAPPGAIVGLTGVGAPSPDALELAVANGRGLVRQDGTGALIGSIPLFVIDGGWPTPPTGAQHLVLLRDGIPIAGAKRALTVTALPTAAGTSQVALTALRGIAQRLAMFGAQQAKTGGLDEAYFHAMTGALSQIIGGTDPRSLASRIGQLAATDPAGLALHDALLATTGVVPALQQLEGLLAAVAPAAPASLVRAAPTVARTQAAAGWPDLAVASPAALLIEVSDDVLARKMQLYVVVQLFSETVVNGTASTWANYVSVGFGVLSLLGQQFPPAVYTGLVLAIADFVANKIIVALMPARLQAFQLDLASTQLNFSDVTDATITAIAVNDPPSFGIQDLVNLTLNVIGAQATDPAIYGFAGQAGRDVAAFFLGFVQNLLTVFAGQHPDLNVDVNLSFIPDLIWRATVADPRFVERKTQTPSTITGLPTLVNWQASATTPGAGRIFAQTSMDPQAIMITPPPGITYTGGAFGENVEITNVVTVQVGGTSVSVNPTTVTLAPGGSQAFTPTVTGNANTAVTWSTTDPGGLVSVSGGYSAGQVAGVYFVTATSVADPTKAASAAVTVQTPPASTGILTLTRIDGAAQVQGFPPGGNACTRSNFLPTTTPIPTSYQTPTSSCQNASFALSAQERYDAVTTSSGALLSLSGSGDFSQGTLVAGASILGMAYARYDLLVTGGDVHVTLSGSLTASVSSDTLSPDAQASFILSEDPGVRLVDRTAGRSGGSNVPMSPNTNLSGTYKLVPGRYRINVFVDGDAVGTVDAPAVSGSARYSFMLVVQ